MTTPITDTNRQKVEALLTTARTALEEIAEGRFGICSEARQAVNAARDNISRADMLVFNQPAKHE